MAEPPRAQGKGQKVAFPPRGDIFLVSFDPTVGAGIQKTRPALVTRTNIGNQYSPITIVAGITSKFDLPPYPTEVVMEPTDSALQTSAVVLNQIRSVDRALAIRLGQVGV